MLTVTLMILLNNMDIVKIRNADLRYLGYKTTKKCHLYRVIQDDISIKVFYYPENGKLKIKCAEGEIKNVIALERAIIKK